MAHTCPRRAEMGMDRFDSNFVGAGENLDNWTTDHGLNGQKRACSYCGSMHPDDFMAACEEGVEIGPTDKNYKAYVKAPRYGKFYFQHLSDDQRRRFVELLNTRSMNIGEPGHFYRLPFFVRAGGAS